MHGPVGKTTPEREKGPPAMDPSAPAHSAPPPSLDALCSAGRGAQVQRPNSTEPEQPVQVNNQSRKSTRLSCRAA